MLWLSPATRTLLTNGEVYAGETWYFVLERTQLEPVGTSLVETGGSQLGLILPPGDVGGECCGHPLTSLIRMAAWTSGCSLPGQSPELQGKAEEPSGVGKLLRDPRPWGSASGLSVRFFEGRGPGHCHGFLVSRFNPEGSRFLEMGESCYLEDTRF